VAVTEKQRHELMKAMEGALGPEPAETLMNLLPPVGWADVATKSDLDHLRVAGRADIDLVRAELRSEMGELRGELRSEMGELRGELRSEMGELRGELRSEMGELRVDVERLRGDLERGLRLQLVTILSANAVMLGIAVTLAGRFG
jgi:hypothetical protein